MREVPAKVADRFNIVKKLGEGSFGEVYEAKDTKTQASVAIKFEEANGSQSGVLQNEYKMLDKLRRPYQRHGYAEVLSFCRAGCWNIMVMELLGTSLEDCMESCDMKFTVKTTTLVAQQVLHRIEYLHSKHIVHRDIKPENFMWGIGRKVHHLYLIDFGLSVGYWTGKRHVAMSSSQSLTGTARYASIPAHKGCTQSRRDDLEAIAHMLIYFLRGALPWSGLSARTAEEKFRKITETKERYPLDELCKGFPEEFKEFLKYTRKLGFKDRPDYRGWQANFQRVRDQEGVKEDWELQWLDLNNLDTRTLIPMDPGQGHVQPEDVARKSGAGLNGLLNWGRRSQVSGPKDKE